MQANKSPDTVRSTVKVAEFRILHGLMERKSMIQAPTTRANLRREIGLGTVIFEAAIQNLLSGQFVNTCPQRGLTLTRKGMLHILEHRTNAWTN